MPKTQQNVRENTAGFCNARPQLSVAESPDGGEYPTGDPDDERQPHAAGVLQHALRGDEDPGADDGTDYEGDAATQADLAFEYHTLALLASCHRGSILERTYTIIITGGRHDLQYRKLLEVAGLRLEQSW